MKITLHTAGIGFGGRHWPQGTSREEYPSGIAVESIDAVARREMGDGGEMIGEFFEHFNWKLDRSSIEYPLGLQAGESCNGVRAAKSSDIFLHDLVGPRQVRTIGLGIG